LFSDSRRSGGRLPHRPSLGRQVLRRSGPQDTHLGVGDTETVHSLPRLGQYGGYFVRAYTVAIRRPLTCQKTGRLVCCSGTGDTEAVQSAVYSRHGRYRGCSTGRSLRRSILAHRSMRKVWAIWKPLKVAQLRRRASEPVS